MKLIYIAFMLCISCGRGPAENRGAINCANHILLTILTNREFKDQTLDILNIAVYEYQCTKNNDSTINRYYRGYAQNKE